MTCHTPSLHNELHFGNEEIKAKRLWHLYTIFEDVTLIIVEDITFISKHNVRSPSSARDMPCHSTNKAHRPATKTRHD